uniref:LSM domain-containing protein n=1 Tax=Parascaris univalens TaxID=6257 RepID=A0A915BHN3_PARUN
MDAFAADFDAKRALQEGCPVDIGDGEVRRLPSVDHFERFLCETNSELCTQLIEIEYANAQHVSHSSTVLPTGKLREKSLAELYAKKKELLEADKPSSSASGDAKSALVPKARVTHQYKKPVDKTTVLYRMSEGTYDGPLGKLQKWMKARKRVRITLRGRNVVNAVITAVIVAFDKHWNMIIRW